MQVLCRNGECSIPGNSRFRVQHAAKVFSIIFYQTVCMNGWEQAFISTCDLIPSDQFGPTHVFAQKKPDFSPLYSAKLDKIPVGIPSRTSSVI